MNHSTSGLPVHHQLPEFTQTHVHRVSDAIWVQVKAYVHCGLSSLSQHLLGPPSPVLGRPCSSNVRMAGKARSCWLRGAHAPPLGGVTDHCSWGITAPTAGPVTQPSSPWGQGQTQARVPLSIRRSRGLGRVRGPSTASSGDVRLPPTWRLWPSGQ